MPELTTVKVVAVRFPVSFFGGTEKKMYIDVFYNILIYN